MGHPLAAGELTRLAARAHRLVHDGRRALLGIVGPPGAGKSTLVQALLADPLLAGLGDAVAHVPMDGFHLADVQLAALRRLDRKGAPDTFDAAGYVALLRRLRLAEPDVVYAPGFDRQLDQPVAASLAVPPSARLVLTEGNYLLLDDGPWAGVRGLLDEVWYVDVPDAVRVARLVARHQRYGRSGAQAADWVAAVDEPNAARVRATRERADLVVALP